MNDAMKILLVNYPTWKHWYEKDWMWLLGRKPKNIDYQQFMLEYAFVVLNSGFRAETIAKLWPDFRSAFKQWHIGFPPISWNVPKARQIFNNERKVNAIVDVGTRFHQGFKIWWPFISKDTETALIQLEFLPMIGPITKYHLARNLGFECFKPDRWILRLAESCECPPVELFEKMKGHTGDSFGIIDMVLWRACEQGKVPFLNERI